MADRTELLRDGGPTPQRLVVGGYVSRNRPAPVTFADELWVILPEYSLERLYGPCEWGAIHGATLPAQGARVVVIFDDRNIPVVVWWAGAHT
jgi:hypothetical protein